MAVQGAFVVKKTVFFILFLFIYTKAFGCFGIELFIGYDERDKTGYYMASLLELYIKEKTGIETRLISVNENNLKKLLDDQKVDVLVYSVKDTKNLTGLNIIKDGNFLIYYRTKIKEDLRFSTLEEALNRLTSRFTKSNLQELLSLIEKKGKPKRTIKEFLLEKGFW